MTPEYEELLDLYVKRKTELDETWKKYQACQASVDELRGHRELQKKEIERLEILVGHAKELLQELHSEATGKWKTKLDQFLSQFK